jgi:hypothetical protein
MERRVLKIPARRIGLTALTPVSGLGARRDFERLGNLQKSAKSENFDGECGNTPTEHEVEGFGRHPRDGGSSTHRHSSM